jgi:hypothetical protein
MSCYRILKRAGLIQPTRVGRDLREAAERRRQMLKAPEKFNEVLQGDSTDYVTKDGEKYRIGCITEYLSRFNLVSEVLDTETALDLIAPRRALLKELFGHARCSRSSLAPGGSSSSVINPKTPSPLLALVLLPLGPLPHPPSSALAPRQPFKKRISTACSPISFWSSSTWRSSTAFSLPDPLQPSNANAALPPS